MSLQQFKYLVTNRQSWKLFPSGHKGMEAIEQLLIQIPFLKILIKNLKEQGRVVLRTTEASEKVKQKLCLVCIKFHELIIMCTIISD